jgi:hypothetical protein
MRALILTLIIGTALFAAPTHVQLSGGAMPVGGSTRCTGPHYAADYRYVSEPGGFDDPTWRVMHELKFRNCVRDGSRRWADPLSLKIGCRRDHGDFWTVHLRKVRFNSRMWDRDHHEVNPGSKGLECNRHKWSTRVLRFDAMSKFHRCALGGPRVDTHVTFDVVGTNPTTRLSSAFWGFTGPVRITC